jgi:hypothetical protein
MLEAKKNQLLVKKFGDIKRQRCISSNAHPHLDFKKQPFGDCQKRERDRNNSQTEESSCNIPTSLSSLFQV